MPVPVIHRFLRQIACRCSAQRGSAAVEYVGLGIVVSMLMAAAASVVDSAAGERLARAIVQHLLDRIISVS